jgi:hypothetical protein
VIVKNYRYTHNRGFLILGGGVVVWPLVGDLLRMGMLTVIRQIRNGQHISYFPFSLVSSGQIMPGDLLINYTYAYQVIHAALILIGLVMIGHAINRTHTVSTVN